MFQINGGTWLIKITNYNSSVFRMPNGKYTVGVCDDKIKTIYLSNRLKGSLLKKVLCHELVHAAMFSYNVELDYEQEELIANLIATYGEEIIQKTNEIFRRLHK